MESVHVFLATGRFDSEEEVRRFVEATRTADGEEKPSPFLSGIALRNHEPACIEVVHAVSTKSLRDLLCGASYADQWLSKLDPNRLADTAICVFGPNRVDDPHASSLEYCGAFPYLP